MPQRDGKKDKEVAKAGKKRPVSEKTENSGKKSCVRTRSTVGKDMAMVANK